MKKYDLIKLLSAIALTFTLSACTDDSKTTTTKEVSTKTAKVEVKEPVKEEIKKTEVKEEIKKEVEAVKKTEPKKDIQVNLAACKGCHGANFEVSALGKSKIVANMTKDEVSNALVGYKNGTYGGSMKGIMKGQVAKYSIEALRNTGLGK